MRLPSFRRRGWWLPWLCVAGCAAPRVHVVTVPSTAQVFVDGQVRESPGGQEFPLPYYGRLRLEATAVGHVDQLVWIELSEPVTPWLFPADFLLEVGGILLGRDHDVRCRVVLPREAAPEGEPALQELRERARRMELAR